MADPGPPKRLPGKMFAGIAFARGRDVGMGENAFWRDCASRADIARKSDDGFDLRVGIGRQFFMPAIDDFYTDRRGIEIARAFPKSVTRMPGSSILCDELDDAAVFPDEIVRGDLRGGI